MHCNSRNLRLKEHAEKKYATKYVLLTYPIQYAGDNDDDDESVMFSFVQLKKLKDLWLVLLSYKECGSDDESSESESS